MLAELALVPFAEPRGISRRTCSKCGEDKALGEFNRDKRKSLGRRSDCKACEAAKKAEYRATNRGAIRAQHAEWRASNRDAIREYNAKRNQTPERKAAKRTRNAKRRALKRGAWTDNHTAAGLLAWWDEIGAYGCVYCGAPYEHADHIAPLVRGGDHSLGNLLPACAGCNCSKGGKDPAEWLSERFPVLAGRLAPLVGRWALLEGFSESDE